MLGARAQLVGMREANTGSGALGTVFSRRTGEPFERLVDEECGANDSMLSQTVRYAVRLFLPQGADPAARAPPAELRTRERV